MKLAYRGFDKSGRPVSATIDAADKLIALDELRRRGLYITEIVEDLIAGRASGVAGARQPTSRPGDRLKQLAIFSRQLHVLVVSGTPLANALAAIERQTDSPSWRGIVAALRRRVEEGASLSDAMENHPTFFDPVCRSLVAAGESSGTMAAMLERLSSLTRRQLQLRNQVFGALVYPTLLIVVGISVLITMLLFVIPRFAIMFESLAVALPPSTKALLFLSEQLRGNWPLLIVLTIGASLGVRVFVKSRRGLVHLQRLLLNLPKLGKLTRNLISARIARLLGVLLQSQVPLIEALRLTGRAAGQGRYEELIRRAEEAVSRGDSMSTAFAHSDLINPSMYEAIHHGEESGQVGAMLLHVADFLDEENEVLLRSLTSLIEPLILLWLGVIVGFIAVSMFLPLFDLTASAQGGTP